MQASPAIAAVPAGAGEDAAVVIEGVDAFSAYVRAFVHQAKPFYFGDNNTGWTADFDFLLRDDTLTGVREAKFADRGMA